MSDREMVLCVPDNQIKPILSTVEKFIKLIDPAIYTNFITRITNQLWFGTRHILDAETNWPQFRQLIPYVTLYNPVTKSVLAYKRSFSGGEIRLYNLWSLGFGGHINLNDVEMDHEDKEAIDPINTINNNIKRELHEELGIRIDTKDITPIGFIYYPVNKRDTVNSVHFGLSMWYNVNRIDIGILNETMDDINATASKKRWINIKELEEFEDPNNKWEDWSKEVIKYIVETMLNPDKLSDEEIEDNDDEIGIPEDNIIKTTDDNTEDTDNAFDINSSKSTL